MIELVPMAYRLVNELDAADALAASDRGAGKEGAGNEKRSSQEGGAAGSVAGTATSMTSASASATTNNNKKLDDEEERDAVFYRLETLGYRVGLGLVER